VHKVLGAAFGAAEQLIVRGELALFGSHAFSAASTCHLKKISLQ